MHYVRLRKLTFTYFDIIEEKKCDKHTKDIFFLLVMKIIRFYIRSHKIENSLCHLNEMYFYSTMGIQRMLIKIQRLNVFNIVMN